MPSIARLRDYAAAEQARCLAIGQATADEREIVRLFGEIADAIEGLSKIDAVSPDTIRDLSAAVVEAADAVGHDFNCALEAAGALGEVNIDWAEAGMTDLRRALVERAVERMAAE